MTININRLINLVVLFILPAGVILACGKAPIAIEDGKLEVVVSILPQRYFVERIGGEYVNVNVMVVPGSSPATYEPKPEQLKALSQAVAYFSIGVPFENVWLDRIAAINPDMMMVDTIADIVRMPMRTHHLHGEETEIEENEGAPDPHVWLSPELVKLQAQTIYVALAQLDPIHSDSYAANLEIFIADIDDLEEEITVALSGLKSRKFMVFHPAWGYFAADFGLEQIAVEVGGQEPSAQELAQLIESAKEAGITIVFAQPEFSTQDAQTIAEEIDGEVLLISPLALDWLENLRTVSLTISGVLNR